MWTLLCEECFVQETKDGNCSQNQTFVLWLEEKYVASQGCAREVIRLIVLRSRGTKQNKLGEKEWKNLLFYNYIVSVVQLLWW